MRAPNRPNDLISRDESGGSMAAINKEGINILFFSMSLGKKRNVQKVRGGKQRKIQHKPNNGY